MQEVNVKALVGKSMAIIFHFGNPFGNLLFFYFKYLTAIFDPITID